MGIIRRQIWTLDEDFELDEDYPSSWNKEEFKNQTSFAARKRYADQHLKKLGSGSARHVYAIDDEKALKLAANKKGLSQNADEHQISTIGWHDDVVAKVFDSHPDDLWIESELARKINPSRFRELTGFNIEEVGTFLNQYNDQRNGKNPHHKVSPEKYDELIESEFITDILSIVDNWDMQTGDWGRISSYGEVKRNGKPQIVLVDYGLTQDTYSSHYMRENDTLKKLHTIVKNEGFKSITKEMMNEIKPPIIDQGDLENISTTVDDVADGGYGGFALLPNSVSQGGLNSDVDENIDKFSNAGNELIDKAIKNIKAFDPNKMFDIYGKNDLKNIYNSYMLAARNIDKILSVTDNDVNLYEKLMKIQEFLKKNRIVNEDLKYNHATDASPESDKYQISEFEEVIHNKFKPETIHKVAKHVAENLGYNGEPKLLGNGDNGFAYDLGDGKVLKITGSETEAAESIRLKGKDNEHLAKIYNVYSINYEGTTLYPILQEKIDTSRTGQLQQYAKELNTIFSRNFKKGISKILQLYHVDPNLYNMAYADKVDRAIESASEEAKNFFYGMLGIMDEVKASKLKTADYFVTDNLGYKNGKLAFFDFGGRYDRSLGKKKPKEMSIGEGGDSRFMTQHGSRDEDWEEDVDMMNERITSWMPKAKSVKIKKKCTIGGKGDGTSEACDQGDIDNIELDEINDDNAGRRKDNTTNVAEEKKSGRYYFNENKSLINEEKVNYGALMLYFDIPKWDKLIDKIKDDDLYDDGSGTFGREDKPHLTVLYGFHDTVKSDDIKDVVSKYNTNDFKLSTSKVSLFENEDFDVVKFDVEPTEELNKLRKEVEKFPKTLTYKDFHPHVTIAYVKSGEGKKYVKDFNDELKLKPNKIIYSTKDKNKTEFNLNESVINELNKSSFQLPPFKIIDNKLILNGNEVGNVFISEKNITDGTHYDLSQIKINPEFRGQMIFSRFMNALIKHANQNNIIISLTPEQMGSGGASTQKLKQLYSALGFKENKGSNRNFEVSNSYIKFPN